MSDLYYPDQIRGIAVAVERLSQYKEAEDEMVHIYHLPDGSGAVNVQLTNPSKAYYVDENGTVFDTRKELENGIKKAESQALRSG